MATKTKKLSADELLDAFKDMTLLELSEFIKKFEETFEVQAAAMAATASLKMFDSLTSSPSHRYRYGSFVGSGSVQ